MPPGIGQFGRNLSAAAPVYWGIGLVPKCGLHFLNFPLETKSATSEGQDS